MTIARKRAGPNGSRPYGLDLHRNIDEGEDCDQRDHVALWKREQPREQHNLISKCSDDIIDGVVKER